MRERVLDGMLAGVEVGEGIGLDFFLFLKGFLIVFGDNGLAGEGVGIGVLLQILLMLRQDW